MDRLKILDRKLWDKVPKEVIAEAEHAAVSSPAWIALQGNGHMVVMDPPGGPDVATGDIIFIAEISPPQA